MSVSLLLIPAAIAAAMGGLGLGAAGAVGASLQGGTASTTGAMEVGTRMRDLGLLAAAVEDLGGTVGVREESLLEAVVADLSLRMTRGEDGIWAAHLAAEGRELSVEEANAFVLALDTAYAARVQRAVVERIRSRAPEAGLALVSEQRGQDDSVTRVLEVQRGG